MVGFVNQIDMAKKQFTLFMISAMYENGGNTIHRFFDGHPEIFVYPFESQPGTFGVNDHYSSLFPRKYRWPTFPLEGNAQDDYERIIDEECKVRLTTQYVSKFRDADLILDNSSRKREFLKLLKGKNRTRKNIMQAFFEATFLAWKNHNSSGHEHIHMGYSPIIGVDAEKIFSDFPNAHIIHIVRNPYSAYADTKKRPVPYSLSRYTQTWNIMQLMALNFSEMFPKHFHVVRFEDLVAGRKSFFTKLAKKLDIKFSDTFMYPSWNGKELVDMFPWGTIRIPTTEMNKKTADELSKSEYVHIKSQTSVINKLLGYDKL